MSNNVHKREVMLISMPFAPLQTPSLGLSLLKAGLMQKEIKAKIEYFHLAFANKIGLDTYSYISSGKPSTTYLLGEWIFSEALFDGQNNTTEYIEKVLPNSLEIAHLIPIWIGIKQQTQSFISDCLTYILEENPIVVGFTSVFQQNTASLALAKQIKVHLPETLIVFGGANCEGVMGEEILRQFSFVDVVVSGEADAIFPEMMERYLKEKTIPIFNGVRVQPWIESFEPKLNKNMKVELDELPYPDFEDFFETIEQLELKDSIDIQLLFESSRGCWWGEIQHCTFCGLNGTSMNYRSKNAQRAFNELVTLYQKYPYPIAIVDNILDMKYFHNFLPMIAQAGLNMQLFYEVKANLKKEQLRKLRAANIQMIQPGIESLDSEILESMRKGVKAIQNIQLLKWSKELGIFSAWNILLGFPEEKQSHYEKIIKLIPLITHLTPPYGASSLRLDRFSPNFNESKKLGFRAIKPFNAYSFIYPFSNEALHNLAYFFDYEYANDWIEREEYINRLKEKVKAWREEHANEDFFYIDKEDKLLMCDFRAIATQNIAILNNWERFIYIECDEMKTSRQLAEIYQTKTGQLPNMDLIQQTLKFFVEKQWMIYENYHYLSLALPTYHYVPNANILEKMKATFSNKSAT